MDDRFDGDELFGETPAEPPRRPHEGVRILGADEARAARQLVPTEDAADRP